MLLEKKKRGGARIPDEVAALSRLASRHGIVDDGGGAEYSRVNLYIIEALNQKRALQTTKNKIRASRDTIFAVMLQWDRLPGVPHLTFFVQTLAHPCVQTKGKRTVQGGWRQQHQLEAALVHLPS